MTPTLAAFAESTGLEPLAATTDAGGNVLHIFSWPMLARLAPGKAAAFVTAIEWPDGGWLINASISATSLNGTAPAGQHARLVQLKSALGDLRPLLRRLASGGVIEINDALAQLANVNDLLGPEE